MVTVGSALHVPSQAPATGLCVDITPASAGWQYVSFQVLKLAPGERVDRRHAEQEACVVLLGGRCAAWIGDAYWPSVGDRTSPFDGLPHALYVPPATDYALLAQTPLEVAIGLAPAPVSHRVLGPRRIAPEDVRVAQRGSGCMERTIHDILMEDQPALSLLVTEVLTPGGHWSSYPPHKHDTPDPPRETALEELYYHRLKDPAGWAVQRVYTRDRGLDTTLVVRDGDCVLVPRGYHPVSAAPGFDLYYLNVMAGPVRQWRVTLDPDVEAAVRA